MKNNPKTFISYTHDPVVNKLWVSNLATKLRENGIDVILDQWDLRPGQDFILFMEKYIHQCDFIILIINEVYYTKTQEPKGGAGYERMLITAELVKDMGIDKFIPIVKQEPGQFLLPNFIGTKMALNFSNEDEFKENFEELLRRLYGLDSLRKPALGKNPFTKEEVDTQFSQDAQQIFKAFISAYNRGQDKVHDSKFDMFNGELDLESFENSIRLSKIKFELALKELIKLNVVEHFSSMTGRSFHWLTDEGLKLAHRKGY